jgi:hypothetical protein
MARGGLAVPSVADPFGLAEGPFQGVGWEHLDGCGDAYSVFDPA